MGVSLVLAAVLLIAGVVVSGYVARSDRNALDDRLKRTAELSRVFALRTIEDALPTDDRRLDDVLSATGTSLRLLLGSRVLYHVGLQPRHQPAPRLGLRTFETGGERYRAYSTNLRGAGNLARLQVTTRLKPLEDRQSALGRRLAGLGALALLVAAAGVWLTTGLIIRPLRRLRAVTSSIAGDEDLDRRVPEDDGPLELRSLAASYNAMLARLGRSAADRERALAATRRFAADAGHELRTPLTSVQTTLSTLRRHPDIPPEQRAGLLDDAMGENQRLVALLQGLQTLARGDAAGLQHTRVDLVELVGAAVDEAASRHPRVHFTTQLPDDGAPELVGWEPGLRLLVDNLLENAVRHGRADGQVALTLTRDQLVVEDDGPGVPEAERERVFEPFARVGETDRPGSGLGLALVAQQAGHHGATVAVDRSPLGGARFVVRFAP